MRMRELCEIADIITPNITEAAILLDRAPESKPCCQEEAGEWMQQLRVRYGARVVLTGLAFEKGCIGSGCLAGDKAVFHMHNRIERYYPGTGDLFASVMLGALLNGRALEDACDLAGEYVKDCIAYTAAQQTDPVDGVQFEKLLGKIIGVSNET